MSADESPVSTDAVPAAESVDSGAEQVADAAVSTTPPLTVARTRASALWVSAVVSALLLLVLLVFILQNLQRVKISFLAWHGHLPLAVALLLAAVLGVLLVAIPGSGRILQLRRASIRHARRESRTGPPA
jgi:uncharacterized integral membrane protein